MNPRTLIMASVLAASLLGGVWWTYRAQVSTPVGALRDEVAAARSAVEAGQRASKNLDELEKALKEIGARAPAADGERAVHAVRVALRELAVGAGLASVRVETDRARLIGSPAERSFGRSLRDRPDFGVIRATLAGDGGEAAVLGALAALESLGWPMRVASLSISATPGGGDDALRLRARVEVAFIPGIAPSADMAGERDPALVERWTAASAAVADRRPFAGPSASEPEPVEENARRPAPAPATPNQRERRSRWRVAGIVEGAGGREVWLTGPGDAARRLGVGEGLLGLRVVSIGVRAVVLEPAAGGAAGEEGDAEASRGRTSLKVGDRLDGGQPAGSGG